MCRGFQQNERDRLKIKAFYTHLSISCSKNKINFPDFLTLHFLPRINGTFLEINGSRVQPNSPAFVTLHRVLSKDGINGVTYGCRDGVTACEGVRFEVYFGDLKVLRGIFRIDDRESWKMECKCDDFVEGVKDAEVYVEAEGVVALMSEKVEMAAAGRRRRRRRRCCELEEIPEEREEGELGSDVCWCSECGGGEDGADGGDGEVEVEGVGWAVDVGLWVVCLGVGYLVSRASSSKRLRRMRLIR